MEKWKRLQQALVAINVIIIVGSLLFHYWPVITTSPTPVTSYQNPLDNYSMHYTDSSTFDLDHDGQQELLLSMYYYEAGVSGHAHTVLAVLSANGSALYEQAKLDFNAPPGQSGWNAIVYSIMAYQYPTGTRIIIVGSWYTGSGVESDGFVALYSYHHNFTLVSMQTFKPLYDIIGTTHAAVSPNGDIIIWSTEAKYLDRNYLGIRTYQVTDDHLVATSTQAELPKFFTATDGAGTGKILEQDGHTYLLLSTGIPNGANDTLSLWRWQDTFLLQDAVQLSYSLGQHVASMTSIGQQVAVGMIQAAETYNITSFAISNNQLVPRFIDAGPANDIRLGSHQSQLLVFLQQNQHEHDVSLLRELSHGNTTTIATFSTVGNTFPYAAYQLGQTMVGIYGSYDTVLSVELWSGNV